MIGKEEEEEEEGEENRRGENKHIAHSIFHFFVVGKSLSASLTVSFLIIC